MSKFIASAADAGAADCLCCGVSRRAFLRGASALAGASALGAPAIAQAPTRIDTHHHYYPPAVQNFPGVANPMIANWSPAKSLEEMDKNGVKVGILSMASAPLTASSLNSSTSSKPCRLAKAAMAARWRLALSLSGPTFAALDVRI